MVHNREGIMEDEINKILAETEETLLQLLDEMKAQVEESIRVTEEITKMLQEQSMRAQCKAMWTEFKEKYYLWK